MLSRRALPTAVALLLMPTLANAKDIWADWEHLGKSMCPSHHLEWLPDIWLDLPDDFSKTMSAAEVKLVLSHRDDITRRCAKELMGWYCEGSVNMEAYRRAGVLEKFARYSCDRFVCTEASICSDREHR